MASTELQEEYCIAPREGVGEVKVQAFEQAVVVLGSARVPSRCTVSRSQIATFLSVWMHNSEQIVIRRRQTCRRKVGGGGGGVWSL
jgi:hypothetical protein